MNKFKLERKTIEAARLRRTRDRVQASIAKVDPTAWQRLIDRLGGEKVTETFVFGEDGTSTVEPDEWIGHGYGYGATVDDVVKLDQEDYKHLGNYFDWLLKPTTVNNNAHTVRLRSLSFDATVA